MVFLSCSACACVERAVSCFISVFLCITEWLEMSDKGLVVFFFSWFFRVILVTLSCLACRWVKVAYFYVFFSVVFRITDFLEMSQNEKYENSVTSSFKSRAISFLSICLLYFSLRLGQGKRSRREPLVIPFCMFILPLILKTTITSWYPSIMSILTLQHL